MIALAFREVSGNWNGEPVGKTEEEQEQEQEQEQQQQIVVTVCK